MEPVLPILNLVPRVSFFSSGAGEDARSEAPRTRSRCLVYLGPESFMKTYSLLNLMCFVCLKGYDMEDAMILNKASFERGFAHGTVLKCEVRRQSFFVSRGLACIHFTFYCFSSTR